MIYRIFWIFFIFYILLSPFFTEYQTSLTCYRSQDLCQLSNKMILRTKIEKFPVKSLIRAEAVGGGEATSGVLLKTSQGDKTTLATPFSSEAEAAATEINTFLSNPRQEVLQVNNQLDIIAVIWILIGMIFYGIIGISIIFYGIKGLIGVLSR
jgi:hypothetical protein